MPKRDWNKELERVEKRYEKLNSTRPREAVYVYLKSVYRLAWNLKSLSSDKIIEDVLSEIIGPSTKPNIRRIIDATCDERAELKSKWYRALLYCFEKGKDPRVLVDFMREEKGGINNCAAGVSKKARKAKRARKSVKRKSRKTR